jgi:hypothetical protein
MLEDVPNDAAFIFSAPYFGCEMPIFCIPEN